MEIEKAINVLHNCENSARGTSLSTACHMAISALREQQEREKPIGITLNYGIYLCGACKNPVHKIDEYCKHCGRRLKEAQKDDK